MAGFSMWVGVGTAAAAVVAIACSNSDTQVSYCSGAIEHATNLSSAGAARVEAAEQMLKSSPDGLKDLLRIVASPPSGEPLEQLSDIAVQDRAVQDILGEVARHCGEGAKK